MFNKFFKSRPNNQFLETGSVEDVEPEENPEEIKKDRTMDTLREQECYTSVEMAIAAGDMFYEMFDHKNWVVLVDAESKVIKCWNTKTFNFGIKPGDTMPEGTIVNEALVTGARVAKQVSKEESKFGFAYAGIGIPVKDKENNIIGGLAATFLYIDPDKLQNVADELHTASEQNSYAAEEIAKGATNLSHSVQVLTENTDNARKSLKTINDVIELIKGIADQTNLLALNAAIEAARAGEHGRGFAVVADEVRKLAQNSADSAKDMAEKLSAIHSMIESVGEKVQELNGLAQQQAASTEEISASMEQLDEQAKVILDLAEELKTGLEFMLN